ncbi:MAG: hypothetical protein IJI57_04870 [Flexilinea sp.]|nr:hypothetical protein [Flexilinea sp.]
MEERIKILSCKNCGGKALLYRGDEDKLRPYYLKCEHCNNRSNAYIHIDTAILDWNDNNKPQKAKVTYHCGNCGAEVIMGFDVCTKCNTEIIWS